MQDSTHHYRVIGLMSGSSLDGLDMACVDLTCSGGQWSFNMIEAMCQPYSPEWQARLRNAHHLSGIDLWQLHADFGRYSGEAVAGFVKDHALRDVTLVASHGHTVFHSPDKHFTIQLGDGAALARYAGLPVACDFRSADMAKNGQGAPLVPIGDRLLFGDIKFMLNLGGIANVTLNDPAKTVAFDIASANQVLNYYAHKQGLEFDDGGRIAATGALHKEAFDALNALDYYRQPFPKSLDNGYSRDVVIPLLDKFDLTVADGLHTFCEHIAYQIGQSLAQLGAKTGDKLRATGGGALNHHLMQRIAHYTPVEIMPHDEAIIQYKEAVVFALIGVLRLREETNILASVTGAGADSCGGALYQP